MDGLSGRLGAPHQAGDAGLQVNYFGSGHPGGRGAATGAGVVIVGDVPHEPAAFQPRAGLLEELRAAGPGMAVVRAVTGMRGVGKTQAAAYARWCIDAGWRLVAWVNAEDAAGVVSGLAATAVRLGVADSGERPDVAAGLLRHHLEGDGDRRLMVFDNVTDLTDLRRFLPVAGKSQVVVTTTSSSSGAGRVLPVGVFTEAEAAAFLTERTGRANAAGAAELAREVGCLPLALGQAGAVIAAQRLSYQVYLGRLRSLPVREYLTPSRGEPYPRGVAEAVLLSLDAVEAADKAGLCRGVLEVVSLLSPAGAPRQFLYAAGEAGMLARPGAAGVTVTAREVDEAVGVLAEGALLAFSGDDSVVTHRLVMRVIRERCANEGSLADLGTRLCDLLAEVSVPWAENYHDRQAAREVVGQVTALHEHLAPVLTGAHPRLVEKLLERRVWTLDWTTGSPRQEAEYAECVAVDCQELLGESHRNTLKSRSMLANAYARAGRVDDAIHLLERTVADQKRLLGADDLDTLSSSGELASAYDYAWRPAEAVSLFEQILPEFERLLV